MACSLSSNASLLRLPHMWDHYRLVIASLSLNADAWCVDAVLCLRSDALLCGCAFVCIAAGTGAKRV